MEANLDVFVALPTFPHFSHLYPESRRSWDMNLSRAWVTSAKAKFEVGDVDREELVYRVEEEELRSDPPRAGAEADDGFVTGKISNPISSIGSILQDVARQAEHVTLDSTVPRKRRKGYSLSSAEES
mmetsp:Transcript_31987/g.47773  ORF Transcript_31987/g.47773 Transcript_31987/m.47773 type:complete len:127 (-) Transcript_31987:1206-1586(-)